MERSSSLERDLIDGLTGDEAVGGYEHRFVEEVSDEYKCCICLEVMRSPYQIVPCGHCCCRSCLKQLLSTFGDKATCPIDREPVCKSTMFPDNNCNRKIQNLKIFCDKWDSGCNWQGELLNYKTHTNSCLYIEVPCSNEGCDKIFIRKDISEHQSSCLWCVIQCPKCNDSMRKLELEQHKREVCPNEVLPCVAGCPMKIARIYMEKHINIDCEETVIECPWKALGCQMEEKTRRDVRYHLNDVTAHSDLLLAELQKLRVGQQRILSLEDESRRLDFAQHQNTACGCKDKNLYYTWPLTPVSELRLSCEARSPVFSTGSHGYCFSLALLPRLYDTIISIRLVPGIYDQFLPWPFKCNFSIALLDQTSSETQLQHILKAVDFRDFDSDSRIPQCYQRPNYEDGSPLYPLLIVLNDTLKNERYSVNDRIFIMVKIKPYNFEENLAI